MWRTAPSLVDPKRHREIFDCIHRLLVEVADTVECFVAGLDAEVAEAMAEGDLKKVRARTSEAEAAVRPFLLGTDGINAHYHGGLRKYDAYRELDRIIRPLHGSGSVTFHPGVM